VQGLEKDAFLKDKRTQQAVIISVIITGEAATKVSNIKNKSRKNGKIDIIGNPKFTRCAIGKFARFCALPNSTDFDMDDMQLDHAAAIRANQAVLRGALKSSYDFIVFGSGSAGSVVAARLAEDPAVQVLLLEAGGSDEVESVIEPAQWPLNLGSERDWGFVARPNPHLNGRSIPMNMGKVLGGGSSINVMLCARGHRSNLDQFIDKLRITTGNTMAPCVVIGERAAAIIKASHGI